MKAVTFCFRNMEPAQSHDIFALLFSTYMVDVTFGKL